VWSSRPSPGAFERREQFGRDFSFGTQALEVAGITGRGPETHDVAGIDGQHRLERGVEEAAMHGGRRRLQLMNLFFGLRLRGRNDDDRADADAKGM
jgi:hypothetical protein